MTLTKLGIRSIFLGVCLSAFSIHFAEAATAIQCPSSYAFTHTTGESWALKSNYSAWSPTIIGGEDKKLESLPGRFQLDVVVVPSYGYIQCDYGDTDQKNQEGFSKFYVIFNGDGSTQLDTGGQSSGFSKIAGGGSEPDTYKCTSIAMYPNKCAWGG